MTDRTNKSATFLDRNSYRQRRFRDLARVLPFLGAVLAAMPLLWPRTGADAAQTSSALIYLFVVWVSLIVMARALASKVADGGAAPPADGAAADASRDASDAGQAGDSR